MLTPDLKYYDINREGWIGISHSEAELSARLQWSDVMDGEYIVIDSEGWYYEAEENDESEYGYDWLCTDRQDVNTLMMLKEHAHGEQLSEEELNFCR